jgi:hypothetical protein
VKNSGQATLCSDRVDVRLLLGLDANPARLVRGLQHGRTRVPMRQSESSAAKGDEDAPEKSAVEFQGLRRDEL